MSEERPWAVILGVSSGTGAAVARQVAVDPGFNIFGVHRGRHPELAAEVERDVRATGRRIHVHVGDAGTAEGARACAEKLREVAGPRSVKFFLHSIANASVGTFASQGKLHPKQFQKTMDSMANSFVYWTQELLEQEPPQQKLPELLAPGAHLLGLSNPMVDTVLRNTGLIAASKAALEIYVRHLAHELGPRGHRVNLLKFGAVITPAVETTFGAERVKNLRDVLHRALPARRLSTMEEVARFIGYLAGDSAAWFNGSTIDFTGGEAQGFFDALLYPDPPKTGNKS